MTKEEINKYIHEQIMDRCWHEVRPQLPDEHNLHWNPACRKCGRVAVDNPDYCSDALPRSLLREACLWFLENNRGQALMVELGKRAVIKDIERWARPETMPQGWQTAVLNTVDVFMFVAMPAEQIARACVAADMGKETKCRQSQN